MPLSILFFLTYFYSVRLQRIWCVWIGATKRGIQNDFEALIAFVLEKIYTTTRILAPIEFNDLEINIKLMTNVASNNLHFKQWITTINIMVD